MRLTGFVVAASIFFISAVAPLGVTIRAATSPELTIAEVAGKDARAMSTVTLKSFDQGLGESIVVDSFALSNGLHVCVMVNMDGVPTGRLYCLAEDRGQGRMIIHGVRFGEGLNQARSYVVRAVALNELPPQGEIMLSDWLEKAIARSGSKRVEIIERAVRSVSCLLTSTVDGRAVDTDRAIAVKAVATVSGTFGCAPVGAGSAVMLLICGSVSRHCRAISTELHGTTWEARSAPIIEPGDPYQSSFLLIAIRTKEPIPGYQIDIEKITDFAAESAPSVMVSASEFDPPTPGDRPMVQLAELMTDKRRVSASDGKKVQLRGEHLTEVRGSYGGMPEGGGIWAVLLLDKDVVAIEGPAILSAGHWIVRLTNLSRQYTSSEQEVRLSAVVAVAKVFPEIVPYRDFYGAALAWAPWTVLESDGRGGGTAAEDSIVKIRQASCSLPTDTHPDQFACLVTGEAENMLDQHRIYLGFRDPFSASWKVVGPAVLNKDSWSLSVVSPRGSVQPPEIVAFQSLGSPPPSLSDEQFALFAVAHSNVTTANVDGVGTSLGLGKETVMLITIVVTLLLLLLLLVWLVRTRRETALRMCHVGSTAVDSVLSGFSSRFPFVRRETYDAWNILGVALLAIGASVAVIYQPTYASVLQKNFGLSSKTAWSLAVMIMVLTAATGIVLHLFASKVTGFARAISVTMMASILLVVMVFQSVVYLTFYAANGESRISEGALGLAAFFFSAVESVLAGWGTFLGWPLIAFLLVVLFMAPFHICKWVLQLIEALAMDVPGRSREDVPTKRLDFKAPDEEEQQVGNYGGSNGNGR